MSDNTFKTPFGAFKLQRLPRNKAEKLRAWDATDEYLLNMLYENKLNLGQTLICNDAFGALSVALSPNLPTNWSDSSLAHKALRKNLAANELDKKSVICLDSLSSPTTEVNLVLIKIPKTLALLEDQLIRLRPKLTKNTKIMLAGMAKHMPSSIWKLLERIIGPTTTSLAVKKARIIEVHYDATLPPIANPYPVSWKLEKSDIELSNHANVFSREKLDVGTRFLLEHLPQTDGDGDIIDLGCGNGVLGLMAARQNPLLKVHFVDESYMAVASARKNFIQIVERDADISDRAQFHVAGGLKNFEDNSVDMVLCNPPFHQHQTVGDSTAKAMFRQAARVLLPGGELWVVGNQHMGYHQRLRREFDRVNLVASNRKFVILKATNLIDE